MNQSFPDASPDVALIELVDEYAADRVQNIEEYLLAPNGAD
jgi:hypothetical protein